jgi:hypothetical protein
MTNFSFDYHLKLTEYFKKQEKTWKWFANSKVQDQQRAEYKKQLLKNSYRLSEDSEPAIYALVAKAQEALNITKNVTIYQELDSLETNARVSYDGNEINVLLSGSLMKNLSEDELLSVLGHELSHIVFYQTQNGDFEITSRIIQSIANDSRSDNTMVETARLFSLYTELFCDRGAMHVVKDRDTVIQALVKVSTGLESVSASNYLKQAHEICKEDNFGSSGQTHPETFLRAIALEYWEEKKVSKEIDKLIDSRWGVSTLDIFKQQEVNVLTEKLLQIITKPKWMRTELIFSHCRQYFPHFAYKDDVFIHQTLKDIVSSSDDTIREYFSYILMDFSLIDSSLEAAPTGHALQIAEELGIHKTLKQLLKKELKLTTKAMDAMLQKAVKEVSSLSESEEESILNEE